MGFAKGTYYLFIHGLVSRVFVKNVLCSNSDAVITDQFQVYHLN